MGRRVLLIKSLPKSKLHHSVNLVQEVLVVAGKINISGFEKVDKN
jgi:hypothetical protein